MIELVNVSKRFGDSFALRPTDAVFESQKTHILLGPSGCGKSTLLKLSLRLLEPDSGSVRFQGEEITPENLLSVRRRIGYVIQSGGLFPHMTARQNVTIVADFLSWPGAQVNSRIDELAELTRLPADALQRYPDELSGGQQQRVGLMRALMLDPEMLLMDEPLGALDPLIRADLQCDLREIFRSLGKTVVMVTHDLHEAAYFGDQITLMREGNVVQRGSFDELQDEPADPFVTQFISAHRASWGTDR